MSSYKVFNAYSDDNLSLVYTPSLPTSMCALIPHFINHVHRAFLVRETFMLTSKHSRYDTNCQVAFRSPTLFGKHLKCHFFRRVCHKISVLSKNHVATYHLRSVSWSLHNGECCIYLLEYIHRSFPGPTTDFARISLFACFMNTKFLCIC